MRSSVGLVVEVGGGPAARAYGQVNPGRDGAGVQAIRACAGHRMRPLAESEANPEALRDDCQRPKAQGTKSAYLNPHPRTIQKGQKEIGHGPYISQRAQARVAELSR